MRRWEPATRASEREAGARGLIQASGTHCPGPWLHGELTAGKGGQELLGLSQNPSLSWPERDSAGDGQGTGVSPA